jgi:hypothetical protein
MIMMEQPSISLNSADVPGPHYSMWKTVTVEKNVSVSDLVSSIKHFDNQAFETLRNVVLNCHGTCGGGFLSLGQGIDNTNVSLFKALKPHNLGTIWVIACQAAMGADGRSLCSSLAKNAGTVVIAGDSNQKVGAFDSYRYYLGRSGQIDDYEGTVYAFWPDGTISRDVDPEEVVYTIKV